jgi:tRNA threonylcarbamoyladenosine biosynthesis protein TsaE
MRELSFLYTHDEIAQAAAQVTSYAGDTKIWLFEGDMGAGKTTLIKAVCQTLGAIGDFSSPTYSLANEYELSDDRGRIFHLDLYRLREIEEALDIGIEEYLFAGSYCMVEWPGLIMPLLKSGEFITINITAVSENQRKVSIFI